MVFDISATENDKAESREEFKPPMCHMKPMNLEFADDGCQQVEFWECQHCGHTKELGRILAGSR